MAESKTRGQYRFWISWFRWCAVSEDKVVVSPPLVFGSGYVFDRKKRIVSASLRIFGLPVSKTQIPFHDIMGLSGGGGGRRQDVNPFSSVGPLKSTVERNFFAVVMEAAHEKRKREFVIAEVNWASPRKRTQRILDAVRDVTGLTADKMAQQERSWIKTHMRLRILEKPGISHTELVFGVSGSQREQALGELVDGGDLTCVQRGRVRRYFIN